MCQNYRDGKCLVGNKNCKLKEEGEDAKQGDCELLGDYRNSKHDRAAE
jgi:hypothetical protein